MLKTIEQRAKLAKKCPCCGSSRLKTERLDFLQNNALHLITIECEDCHLRSTEYISHEDTDYRAAYRRVLLKWNRIGNRRAA